MRNPPKISIVVPVYNVEAFVGRCVDSVIAQNYPALECVIVDDCGNDKSMEIVRARLENYRGNVDFKILRHEHNRGLSAARNTGTQAATGDYVYFLDSDDLISADCIATLAAPLREREVDFVLGNYASGGDKTCFLPVRVPAGIIDGNAKIRETYLRGDWYMMAWNKLVKREFFLRERLFFAEGLLHEDNLWSFQLACVAESMCVVPALTYIYTIRGNSITTARSRKNFDSYVKIAELCEDFARERGFWNVPEIAKFLYNQRENLVPAALKFGVPAAWEIYRKNRRSRKIPVPFRMLGFCSKIRYFHRFFPSPLGFLYLIFSAKFLGFACAVFRYFFRSRR